jgi:hypothetical protein
VQDQPEFWNRCERTFEPPQDCLGFYASSGRDLGICICSPCYGVSAFYGTKENLLEVKSGEDEREKPLIQCNCIPCMIYKKGV